MKRIAVFVLFMLTAVILQTSLLSRIRIFGVGPDLVLVIVIALALIEGPLTGAVAGLGGGLLRDFLLEAPAGLTGLSYLAVGYLVGTIRPYVQTSGVLLPVSAVGLGSLAGTGLYILLSYLLGEQPDPLERVLRVLLLTSLYNAMVTPFVYPVVRRVVSIYPREKVYRL